jgi:hexosaminidase
MIKRLTILILLFSKTLFALDPKEGLMPLPKEFTFDDARFFLTRDFTVSIGADATPRAKAAAGRFLKRLKGRTGIFMDQYEVTGELANASMNISMQREGKNQLYENESYHIIITSKNISLTSETDLGTIHGLETLLQLLQSDSSGYFFEGGNINDAPRFAWRGLLIDVGRHFMPVEVIKRNIDAMVAVKMNVLHFHLTDDQGFRIESKKFPKLHQLGSDGNYFSQDQIRDIVAYADVRGIRVVPEIDIPGHTSSWFVGYPELASGNGPYNISRKYGIMLPSMNPSKEETYNFLDTLFQEMITLFPDAYLHIGGDENNGKEWDANPSIQDFKKDNNLTNNHALQAYFNRRVLDILTKYNKKMIGWDEILQPDLPKNIVIQIWRGKQSMENAVQKGFPVIFSHGYYIDLMQPAGLHYQNDPLPASNTLTGEQKQLVLGGEATMWAETITDETIDSRIWPRTAAIAERLWSPDTVQNIASMYQRMDKVSIELEELGITHEKNYDMMLRRLTGDYDIDALKTLVDVLEPVKFYHRVSDKEVHYTTESPYTRVVDAARPDARIARRFNALVDEYLANPNNKSVVGELKGYLNKWTANHEVLMKTIESHTVLKEIYPLSEHLAAISQIGLQAMLYIETNKKPEKAWNDSANNKLKLAAKPVAQTEIAVVKEIKKLVDKLK